MQSILLLFGFAALIILLAIYTNVKTYREVFRDLRTRDFRQPAARDIWRWVVVLVPIVGALVYHTIYLYEPDGTG